MPSKKASATADSGPQEVQAPPARTSSRTTRSTTRADTVRSHAQKSQRDQPKIKGANRANKEAVSSSKKGRSPPKRAAKSDVRSTATHKTLIPDYIVENKILIIANVLENKWHSNLTDINSSYQTHVDKSKLLQPGNGNICRGSPLLPLTSRLRQAKR